MLAITDKGSDPADFENGDNPSSSSAFPNNSRTGPTDVDFDEIELSPRHQLTMIVHLVASSDKLDILTSSVSIGTRRPYRSSWKLRAQFCWLRRMSPWLQTDII